MSSLMVSLNPCVSEVLIQNISSHYLISHGSFEDLFSIARKSRPKNIEEALQRLNSSSQLTQPEYEAGRDIWLSAQDFTNGNDLELSITNFIEQITRKNVKDLFCVDRSRVHKRQSVFLTDDYAVKVFPRVEERFNKIAAEISGLDIIRDLNLQEGKTTEFIAVGRCVINGEDNLLLLMKRAPGKTIKYYLDSIFTSPHRQYALNECKLVLKQLGRLLGEIHSKKAVTYQGDFPGILEITFEKLKTQVAKSLQEYKTAGGADLEVIAKFFEDILLRFDTKSFHLTISHNDAHLENFIFDAQSGMTVIDTPRIHYTANADGEPLFSSYVHDVARVEDDIAKCILYHEVNEDLINELQKAFRNGYKEKAHKLINTSQLFADKAWTILTRLRSVVPDR
ncbi:MAG: aminoglycoside phosphotransferase family protein, partial [Parachlamydiales bacterium]|nr:aminoglycoside phosphotransferase family protein [Parachlamydiales bacterium]